MNTFCWSDKTIVGVVFMKVAQVTGWVRDDRDRAAHQRPPLAHFLAPKLLLASLVAVGRSRRLHTTCRPVHFRQTRTHPKSPRMPPAERVIAVYADRRRHVVESGTHRYNGFTTSTISTDVTQL